MVGEAVNMSMTSQCMTAVRRIYLMASLALRQEFLGVDQCPGIFHGVWGRCFFSSIVKPRLLGTDRLYLKKAEFRESIVILPQQEIFRPSD